MTQESPADIPATPEADRGDLDAIVKAYDIRGIVGSSITEAVVTAIGAATVDVLGLRGGEIAIGHDMRTSGEAFAEAFERGVRQRGARVRRIGLCSTDESYFVSGKYDIAAAMFTASHNPARYNGIKISRAGAKGLSGDTGLRDIREAARVYLADGIPAAVEPLPEVLRVDVLGEYARYLRTLVPLEGIRPLKIVVDAGNGMGGLTVPAVLGEEAELPHLPIELVPMYFELDGTFPNHEANPLVAENLVDLRRRVVEEHADLGLAFDGDADRCFVVDERGLAVSPSAICAIVAAREIAKERAAGRDDITVLHNAITSRSVAETIERLGATARRTRVGHSLIKAEMARTGAVFGGEHSAHYYFRDFWGADNGMLAAMHVIAELGSGTEPISALADRATPYVASGEINSEVNDAAATLANLVETFGQVSSIDDLDGLTFTSNRSAAGAWWWFNVRPSNTEPLLRLNVEAADGSTMERVRDEALTVIRGGRPTIG